MCLKYNLVDVKYAFNHMLMPYQSVKYPDTKDITDNSLFGGIIYRTDGRLCIDETKFINAFSKPRIGYKIFRENSRGELHAYFDFFKLNKWYTATMEIIQPDNSNRYISGFHVLWSRADARKYNYGIGMKIYNVMYDGVTNLGIDKDCQVVVARKMKILGRINE